MNPWNSFLQTVFQFVKSLFTGVTKKMHRNAAILTMGATLIAVIPFTAVDFQGGGKNAIVAFAETQGGSDEDSLEETEDTALPETDGNVLEDETTADEASSAETEADIRTETEKYRDERGEHHRACCRIGKCGHGSWSGRSCRNRNCGCGG